MAWILFAFTLPWTVTVSYGAGLLSMGLFLTDPRSLRWEGAGIAVLEWRPWFAKRWRYSTTLGRVVFCQPGVGERTSRHELVHVHQVEDRMLLSLIVGAIVATATGDWLLGLALWWSGGMWQLPNFATAALRFGWRNAYRDAEHERSAYAQTDELLPGGKSWWDVRERVRR